MESENATGKRLRHGRPIADQFNQLMADALEQAIMCAKLMGWNDGLRVDHTALCGVCLSTWMDAHGLGQYTSGFVAQEAELTGASVETVGQFIKLSDADIEHAAGRAEMKPLDRQKLRRIIYEARFESTVSAAAYLAAY